MSPLLTLAMRPLGELERVVGGLVVQHLDDHDHAFLGGDVGVDAHFVLQAAGLGDGGDLVDDYGLHGIYSLSAPASAAWNMPVSATIFEKPSASGGVHSPADSP